MIIGINGKIGVGKDLVGSIIQYLTSESGNPKSSKHRSYEEFLSKGGGSNLRNFDQHYVSDWEVKKFAGKLKTIASLLTGIDVKKFENQEFKKLYMGVDWDMTYREFLQKLGTEAMRDGLHTNVWVNALFADYTHGFPSVVTGKYDETIPYPNWIITDMRFPNEMEAVVERKGITIRVVRYPKTVEVSRGPENVETIPFDPTNHKHMNLWKGDISRMHASETALDDSKFDYEIINDGTIEDLVEKVREILIEQRIL